VGKNTVAINNNFRGKLQYLLSSHIVTVIFNQFNIKKKIILEKIIKKTMQRNTVAINNVLKKKITKLNSQSAKY